MEVSGRKINPAFAAQVKEKSDKRTRDVENHEAAHAAASGPYGGGININFGSDELGNRVALSGNVPIKMPPAVTYKNPMPVIENTEKHAETVAFAAIAPAALGGEAGELSSADKAIYNAALKAKALAGSAKSQRLSFEAQMTDRGQQPKRNESLNLLA